MDELSRLAAADDARAAAHAREAVRGRGVAWSGLGPTPFRRRSPDALLRGAKALREACEAWQASPAGRLHMALVRAQALARAAHAAAETARAALARDPACSCAGEVGELRSHASALAQAAEAAMLAASRAPSQPGAGDG